MNTKEKAQAAVNVIGRKPDFTNKRKGYRTLKWYASPRKYGRRLKAAGVVVHCGTEQGHGGPSWMRSSITIKVPLVLSLKEFTDPKPKRVPFKDRSAGDMKQALRRVVNKMDREDLVNLCREWEV